MAQPADHPHAGELVVRNGRQRGTRVHLRSPLTVIGSDAGCDLRLTADGVGPVHCLIAATPGGPFVRSGPGLVVEVNGEETAEGLLADGDEVKVGPCVFRVAWAPVAPIPDADTIPTQVAQIADHLDDRLRQLAEREEQLAAARAAFRRERDDDRDEIDRLKAEAEELHREADRRNERSKRLAARFHARLKRKWSAGRKELKGERASLEEARGRLSAEATRFGIIRAEFHTAAAADRDRMKEAWAAVETQRKRMAAEWAEANDYFARQESALESRAAELAARERAIGGERARAAKETDDLRKEAAGLDARIQHTRAAVEELEQKRERLRAEVLTPPTAPGKEPGPKQQVALTRAADRDLTAWAAELDQREQRATQDRAALSSLKASLDRQSADLADERRVLAEQFTLLAVARARWQEAERRTVAEMEELARDLRHREGDLDAREQRLIRADARRREEAHDLWRFRMKLEGWQSKLTAFEMRWHTEREGLEADLARRGRVLDRRERDLEALFQRWESVRTGERERLRAELQLWADDRARLAKAAAEYDRRAGEVVAELMAHAARAMASEELVAGAVADAGSDRAARRLDVLRKRWEKAFDRRLKEIDARRAEAAAERDRLEERYRELHRLLVEVTGRESAANNRLAATEVALVIASGGVEEVEAPAAGSGSPELAALRGEVERMANTLLEVELPEPPDPPDAELPWAAEEPAATDSPDVLPFERRSAA